MSETAESVEALVQEAYAPEATPTANQEGDLSEAQPQLAGEVTETSPTEAEAARVLKYKGKELSMDDDKFRNFAQKGYDYEQKMHQQRVDRKLFDQEKEALTAKYKDLEQINEYAKNNPQFEQLIQQQWARVQQGQPVEQSPQNEMQVLRSQVNDLVAQMKSQNEANEARRVAEMQATQEGSISAYKDEHSQFDWVKKDELGNTLEDRIGHAMIDNKVENFKIMADSFLLNEHMNRASLDSKEQVGKDIQKVSKLGLGKVTKKSQLGAKKTEDVSKKSYDDLVREGLSDFGIEY